MRKSDSQPSTEPPSPGTSNRESNSQGGQSGDRSGGGKAGGGQKSNNAGTGGAGSNSPADEGANAGNEKGEGDTSDRAGEDREAEGQTGKSGDKAGAGSQSRSKPTKPSQPGGDKNQAGGDGNRPPEKGDQPQPKQPGGEGGSNRGAPQGTGHEADEPAEPAPPAAEVADEANLEYARKATDLALQRLKDQMDKGQTDQELLDRLGWSKQDLEAFVSRWEAMKRKANDQGRQAQAARSELDATLRSLGLHPRGASIKSNHRDDQLERLKEGRRSRPPAEYAEQYRGYTQGISRGRAKDRDKQGGADKSDAPPASRSK